MHGRVPDSDAPDLGVRVAGEQPLGGGQGVVRYLKRAGVHVEGAHDGYRHLPGSPVHRRRWELDVEGLSIEDTLTGALRTAEARWHVHPDVAVGAVSNDSTSVPLQLPNGRVVTLSVVGARLNVERTTWHPRFGESVLTRCVVARLGGPVLRTRLEWST